MKQKNKNQTLHAMIEILGKITILTGILLLADAALSHFLGANLWPFRIIVPGVVLFFCALFMDERNGVVWSIISSVTTMTGLIFWVNVMTGYRATWAYSWTLIYPTAVGLGMLAYSVLKTKPKLSRAGWNYTKVGLGLFGVFAVFFEFIVGLGGFDLEFGWPLLFISLGLFAFTLRGFDIKHDSFPVKKTDYSPSIDKLEQKIRLSGKHLVGGDASTGFMSVTMDGYARSAKPNGTSE